MNAEQFDNHLFNLSQQAADDSAVPFNEEAWQHMEQLLDGDKKKRRFVFWWWLLPLLLVGSGTAVYIYDQKENATTITSNSLNAKTEETGINNQTLKAENKATEDVVLDNVNSSKSSIANANNNSKKIIKETVQPAIKSSPNRKSSEHVKTTAKSSISSNPTNRTKQAVKHSQPSIFDNTNTQNTQLNTQQAASINIPPIVNNATSNNIDNATTNADVKPSVTASVDDKKEISKNVDTSVKIAASTTKDISMKKQSFLKKFEVSAFAAADISAVDLSFKEPKSITFGIGLSYQVTNKLSIATGFGVSRKLYSADSTDYKNQPWVMASYKLKTVDANCLVYELPINLQYQFARGKNVSWFVIGGVSSYFMKSEAYDYNYLYYNIPSKTSYLIEDKNNHLFSILNLAVAYRKQLSKQLSYQLTPFVKIPLTGIGEGKVKLYSAGLQLSVNLKGR